MKYNCDVIRDLLPLYIDGVASEKSAELVREHLAECEKCASLVPEMQSEEVEKAVSEEKADVLRNQAKYFKKKSAFAGAVIAGIFSVPVLVCLVVNLATGAGLSWFFIVLASLLCAASLTVVPLTVPAKKFASAAGSFAASLTLLLGVVCLYTGGGWFFVAASASLFGLSVALLPAVFKNLGILEGRKAIVSLAADTLLFAAMMLSIGFFTEIPRFFRITAAISAVPALLVWLTVITARYIGKNKLTKAGIITALAGICYFFAPWTVNAVMGNIAPLPHFSLVSGGWRVMLAALAVGAVLTAIGIIVTKKRGNKNEKA